MTLIITTISDTAVVQVSDRRHTKTDGSLCDDMAIKAICKTCADACFSTAYTGLAEIEKKRKEALIGGALLGIVYVVGRIFVPVQAHRLFLFFHFGTIVLLSVWLWALHGKKEIEGMRCFVGHFWGLWFPLLSTALQDFISHKFCGWDCVWCDN